MSDEEDAPIDMKITKQENERFVARLPFLGSNRPLVSYHWSNRSIRRL